LIPIDGAEIPTAPELLPNSPREYRGGWHEGVDFPADRGTAVLAAATGTIVRVDRDFVDWDPATQDAALRAATALGYTPEPTLDRIRGRQVWVDLGRGIVVRYAHLDAVADLQVGQLVTRGQVVGAVGSSGFEEGGPHLHFEIRVGDDYLGDWLEGDALARVITRAFD
jgi:murein DD-endopeptidase MepM/ murein hydrolase activator NlpD